jgi:hypothetical protein
MERSRRDADDDAGVPKVIGSLADWAGRLRERLAPVSYVDGATLRDDVPLTPFRARLTLPAEQSPDGVEVREREVVRGKVRIVYEIRCGCGRRWFHRELQRVQLCPRCGSAVLVEAPPAR